MQPAAWPIINEDTERSRHDSRVARPSGSGHTRLPDSPTRACRVRGGCGALPGQRRAQPGIPARLSDLADRLVLAAGRPGATRPPVVPLAMLDDASAADRIGCALDARSRLADARTVSRELSALRSAVTWWQDMGWISHDATTGLRTPPARARAD